MKTIKYDPEKISDDVMEEIFEAAYNWKRSDELFWSDNPSCLDDMFPDAWNEWLCGNFKDYMVNGEFDKELDEFYNTKTIDD